MGLPDYVFFCFIGSACALYMVHVSLRTLLCRMFTNLTYGQCYIISTRAVSGAFALATSIISGRTLIKTVDIMHEPDPVLETYAILMSGYFVYDIMVMYRGFVEKLRDSNKLVNHDTKQLVVAFLNREFFIVIHHFVLQVFGLPVAIVMMMRRRMGVFFMAGLFFAEISTPFYSIRGILKTLKITSGTLYTVNGLLFITTFFFGRILPFPYLYYRYSCYANIPFIRVPFNIPIYCNISSFAFHGLQCYWFCLIIRTALRHIKNGAKTPNHVNDYAKHVTDTLTNGNGHAIESTSKKKD